MNTTTHTPATTIKALELELDALRERLAAVHEAATVWQISCNCQLYRADEAERDARRWRRIADELAAAIARENDAATFAALAEYQAAKEGKANG